MMILKQLSESEPPRAEIIIKKSLFRAELFSVSDAVTAREYVKQQKDCCRNARHIVHAFVIGKHGEILGCSDDGEPAGTAGQPVLAVLKGSGITNVLITVARWFGGTLLGTGGLVKAYAGAAKAVLEYAQTEPLIETTYFSFSCPYESYQRVQNLIERGTLPVSDITTEYGETVTISGSVASIYCRQLADCITELTKGSTPVHFTS
ncbi:MAG: IMPACT family protein [Treponema sp.]